MTIKRFHLINVYLAILCTACSITPLKLYDGPKLQPEALVTFRIHGPLDGPTHNEEIVPAVNVTDVDDRSVNGDRSYRAYILPGQHKFEIRAVKDAYGSMCIAGGVCGYKSSQKTITIYTKAGHTYIFTAVDQGEAITFGYEDKGLNYNPQCLDADGWSKSSKIRNPNITDC